MSESITPRGPSRRAIVTGASSGIGAAFARRLARDQMDLCLVARSRDRLDALAAELRRERAVEVEVRALDLTDRAALEALAGDVSARPPDLLVNNAGFGTVGRFAELDAAEEDREIQLNVAALTRLTHAALPGMLERHQGAVINVSSLAGESAAPYTATYGATKAFVTSLSQALHEELRGTGVKVQALLPGFTRTEFQERAGIDPGTVPSFAWMSAESVVEASLAALERGDALCVPGAGNKVLSGAQRLVPRALLRRIYASAMKRGLD